MIHLTVQQLSSALDGALGGPSLELVVRHLARCHECRDRQARLARLDDALRRLLAQDPHEFFLDDLGRRAESIVVAVARGLPVPPMVTTQPLVDDEDPYQAMEPPEDERPELGRAASLAREAGFGRIGLKPTGFTQPPAGDPDEARRMLEALSAGDTADFEQLTSRDLGETSAPAAPDGPVFDLPAWVKEGAPRGKVVVRTGREVRKLPKLQLALEQLDDRASNLSRGAIEEVFCREPASSLASEDSAALVNDDATAGATTDEPAVDALEIPPPHETPVTDAYEQVADAPAAPPPARARRSRMPMALALTSVGVLLALVALLQLAPSRAPDGSAARNDPGDTAPHDVPGPQVRPAVTPLPVESPVPNPSTPAGPVPADSGAVAPPADSLGKVPGR